MKLCHAVGLTLVGWYLMVPPNRPDRIWGWYYEATGQERPLSDWEIVESYDSSANCQQQRQDFQQLAILMRQNNSPAEGKRTPTDKELDGAFQKLHDEVSPNLDALSDLTVYFLTLRFVGRKDQAGRDPEEDSLSTRWMQIRCIATDDPRLAK